MTVRDVFSSVRESAGEELCAFAWYAGDTIDVLYVDDATDREAVLDGLQTFCDQLTETEAPSSDTLDALGTVRSTVQVREEAVLVHFQLEGQRGILVSLYPPAADDLCTFVDTCREQLENETFRVRNPSRSQPSRRAR